MTPCRAQEDHEGAGEAASRGGGPGLGTAQRLEPSDASLVQPWRLAADCPPGAQANAEQRAQLKQLDEDEEYVMVRPCAPRVSRASHALTLQRFLSPELSED